MGMPAGTYEYFAQERISFGMPVAEALEQELARSPAERLFVISTRSLNRKTDVVSRLVASLGRRHVGTFDECVSHVPRTVAIAAAEAVRIARPDRLIAIGGGSAIDLAKMVLVVLGEGIANARELDRFRVQVDAAGRSTVPPIRSADLRQISIPTTLSGAEFSHTAGAVDEDRHVKDLFIQRDLAAPAVILDPTITVHTPEWVWLASGMRAVDHAVESICSRTAHPFTDATCTRALRMLQRSLRATKADPGDLKARLDAQIGVWLASTGMMRGQYGASHGLSFHLSAIADVPHGHCSCVLLPSVLRYNKVANAEAQAVVAEMLDRPGMDAAEALLELIHDLGLPSRLSEVGIQREHFAKISMDAMQNMLVRNNPRRIDTPANVEAILDMAW